MGNPPRNPWAPESADERNPWAPSEQPTSTKKRPEKKPKKAPEQKETPGEKKPATLSDYEKKKDRLKSDPDLKAAEAIRRLREGAESAEQLEGITALNTALTSVLSKLDKAGVDISKTHDTKTLEEAVDKAKRDGKIKLSTAEEVAVQDLDRIASGSGPTATSVKNDWPQRIEAAKEANKGWYSKYLDYWKEDPRSAGLFTVGSLAALTGIVLAAKWGIEKAFASDAVEQAPEAKKKARKERIIMWASIGLGITSLILGKETIKKILADCGLDYFKIEEKIKRGQELTEDEKKKLEEGSKKVQQRIEDERKKRRKAKSGGGGGGSAEAAGGEAESPASPEPETVPGALETAEETAESQKLSEFGEKLLVGSGAHKLDDGTYLYLTGGTETYFKFSDGKWHWASKEQKESNDWKETGGHYYDDKKKYEKVNAISERLEKGPSGTEEDEVLVVDGERLDSKESSRRRRYVGVTQALTQIYCIDAEAFLHIRGQFAPAFELLRNVEVGKIVDAYHRAQARKEQTISYAELGVPEESGVSEETLYHVSAIISTAFKEADQINKVKPARTTLTEVFMSELGNDPALEISNGVQDEVTSKISELKITSLAELHSSAEEVFNSKVIDDVIEKEKDRFIEHLTAKYEIDLSDFNAAERASFTGFVVLLYGGKFPMNMSDDLIEQTAENNTLNPKVKAAAVKFFKALKAEVTVLVGQCIARYDIKRNPDDPEYEEYNEVLKRYLKMDMLWVKDGFQMALLSDGINFEETSNFQSVGQAKDITMLYLMVHILKQRSPHEAYTHYLSNLIDLGSKSKIDLNLNINFQRLKPYFEKLFNIVMRNTKNWLLDLYTTVKGWEDLDKRPDKIEELSKLTGVEFLLESGRSGGRAALEIPLELLMVISGNFAEKIPPNTTGEQLLKIILTLGGSVSFPVEEQGAGLVYLFGKYYFIKPAGIALDTLSATIQKGPGVGAKTYLLGASPFVVIYGGLGTIKGLATMHSAGWKALGAPIRGIGKGLAAPATMPYNGFLHVRSVYRGTKYAYNVVRHRTVANAEMSAKYYLRYEELVSKTASSGKMQKLAAWRKQPRIQASKLLFHDINNEMRLNWAHYFSINYNDFWGVNPEIAPKLVDAEGKPTATGEVLDGIRYRNKITFDDPNFPNIVRRFEEVLAKLRQIENIGALEEKDLFAAFERVGLNTKEINTLRVKAHNPDYGGFEKFREHLAKDLRAGTSKVRIGRTPASAPKVSGEGAPKAGEAAKTAESAETAAEAVTGSAKTEAALKTAQENLSAVQKRIAEAEADIRTVNRLRKGPEFKAQAAALQKRLDDARKIIADGQRAQAEIERSIQMLEGVRQVEAALDTARAANDAARIAALEGELATVSEAAEEAIAASGRATENIGRLGKLGTAAKWVGRGLGIFGAGVGAGMAVYSGYEAVTTDVEGRGTLKGLEAGMWTASATADAAAVAVMFGAEGAAVTGVSYAAMPLAPLTYAGSAVFETLNEETRKDYEWIQGNPYEVLHEFYTSFNSCSLGDAWTTLGSEALIQRSLEAKTETMHKIFRGLVAIQKDPGLLNDIAGHKLSNQEIEARIEQNYSKYHEFYFRNTVPTGVQSYASAQRYILEAQMFDDIMRLRDEAKEKNQSFIIRGKDPEQDIFNLHLDRYDLIGSKEYPKARVNYDPSHVVAAYKESLMRAIESDECVADNLERMDSSYLIRLYVQLRLVLDPQSPQKAEIDKEEGLREFLTTQVATLAGYLKAGRGINLALASRQPEYFEPKMSVKTLNEQLKGFNNVENKAYLKFERDNYSMTPALQAVYRLGEYFGYTGAPTETELKKFFSEESASYHGLYWNGSTWMLQERGMEFDDTMGPVLTSALIEKIVARMRENANDILEHRHDAIFLDAYDFELEVKRMADILENGLKEGGQRSYRRSEAEAKQEVVAAPRHFDPQKIDYNLPKEELMADYKKTVEYIVSQTAWNNLDYSITNENTIRVFRKDGSAETQITRYGGNIWKLEGDVAGNLSLVQAISMANLVNWADQWMHRERMEGASDSPFLVDGNTIEFDQSWTYFNTTFMENWVGFYDQIGISKERAVDTLNAWYKQNHQRLARAA